MKKLFLMHGPNLNLLGTREPDVYGSITLKQIVRMVKAEARKSRVRVGCFQSNHEGDIVDRIQRLPVQGYSGLIINPGAFTHYSYAIRDAIKAVGLPTVEVHLSDIAKREEFRKVSVVRDVCIDQVKGLGPPGYVKALEILLKAL
jgi:3-dehydroquinate dehydratase-2